MSKAIIDEYIAERDFWRAQAQQWQYIATLLTLKLEAEYSERSFLWIAEARNVGRHYLEVEEMKAGALKVMLKEAPKPEAD